MSLLDDIITDLRSETPEYHVEIATGARLWFKRDSEYSDLLDRRRAIEVQYDAMTEYDDDGKFKKYKGVFPGWEMPRNPDVLRQCIGFANSFIRAEKQVAEKGNPELVWKQDTAEWGLAAFLKLAYNLPVIFAMLCEKVGQGQIEPIIEGEKRRIELAKKNLAACQTGESTSVSDSA